MNKSIYIIILSCILLITTIINILWHRNKDIKVLAYRGNSFIIPRDCKHIALLGCTPNPIKYLQKQRDPIGLMHKIMLKDFLDIDYVYDSFKRTFLLCKEYHIDHLLIAYLPIYYVDMHQLLGNNFVGECKIFLTRIIKEIKQIIKEVVEGVEYQGFTTLIIPPDYQLLRIPTVLSDADARIRYLIKQFPTLKNISESCLETITIINNKGSAEDDMLINYLKYEYLYEKPIAFKTIITGKECFHAYLD